MEIPSFVKNQKLIDWVKEVESLCRPDSVYFCDGSQEEYDLLMASKKAGKEEMAGTE